MYSVIIDVELLSVSNSVNVDKGSGLSNCYIVTYN